MRIIGFGLAFRQISWSAHLLLVLAFSAVMSGKVWAIDIVHSPGPDRTGAVLLDGATLQGDLYAFLDTDSGIKQVQFFIDGALQQKEGVAPWDLGGTAPGGQSLPFDTTTLANGPHEVSAVVRLSDDSTLDLSATVEVDNDSAVLETTPLSFSENIFSETQLQWSLTVQASDGSAPQIDLSTDVGWLSLSVNEGLAPLGTQVTADTVGLGAGIHTGTITISSEAMGSVGVPVTLDVKQGTGSYQLLVSGSPDRSFPTMLLGQPLEGDVHIFASPDTGVSKVEFYLNDPTHSGSPFKTEGVGPFDFAGTAPNGTALPFDVNALTLGFHSVTAELTLSDGSTDYASGRFEIGSESFSFSPSSFSFALIEPAISDTASLHIDHPRGSDEIYTLTSTADWLSVSPDMEVAPSTHTLSVDASGLAPGEYQAEVVVEGSTTDRIPVSLSVQEASSSAFTLLVSRFSDRSSSDNLSGSELSGDAYIHVQPESGVSKVVFFLNSDVGGTPTKTESVAPYDLAGTASSGEALAFDTTSLADGSHFVTAEVFKSDGTSEQVLAGFTVKNALEPGFTLSPDTISVNANSDDPPASETLFLGVNAAADGPSPDYAVSENAPWLTITPLSGNAPDALTLTLDPAGLVGGLYETTVNISSNDLPDIQLPVSLTVLDGLPLLNANPSQISLTLASESGVHTTSFDLTASDDSFAIYQDVSSAGWLSVDANDGVTPETVTLRLDTTGLALGTHSATLDLTADGYVSEQVTVTVDITDANACTPVPCSEVKVDLPYRLEFDGDRGGVADGFGNGTGFSYVMPSSKIISYIPENIELDSLDGLLRITTTKGILSRGSNDQANPLGVGFAGPNQLARISTRVLNPDPGTGNYQQAGIWFGTDEDNYVKLVYNSFPGDPVVEFAYEEGGNAVQSLTDIVGDLSTSHVDLELFADPSTRTVTAIYSAGGGFRSELGTFEVKGELFSFDAAGIDPEVGTRSFAGIAATHRNGSDPITYEFENFIIEASQPETSQSAFEFSRKSHPIDFPTNMVWAPDGKLYVTELLGTIRALTYDEDLNVVSEEQITSLTDTLGSRLTLGITIYHDNPADPGDYSLWVASSSPSISNGVANSSSITRLSGPDFQTVEQVITGLPRAIANHAVNSLHFGPDDRLYIAVGGNTGAGSPVTEPTEFGDRPEQPLSAAIAVADVFAGNFDGTCANDQDITGPAPCDVVTYATGLRNSYDFVFHSNQNIYATDNGLGVTGAFPPSPEPDCSGFSDAALVEDGGNNPGAQPDLLYLLEEGAYYGHPNPSRDECVFKDGALQGVAPLPNYVPPISNLGMNASANGIAEFRSSRACGKLEGDLMIVRFSLGDDVVRATLSEDGLSVAQQEILVTGFNDPLTITEHNGDLFVSEFGSGQLTALRLEPLACWSEAQPMPEMVLDAGSVALNGDLYSVAGKVPAGHIGTVYRYNPDADVWSNVTTKPGAAVENPAVATDGTSIYVFGGSTAPFSGAVNEAWRYDVTSGTWTQLSDMPVALGGVRAEYLDGRILIAGGMDAQGASVNSLLIYDIASDSWSFGPEMAQQRDNPGTAVVDGKLYVLSGRHRLSDGTTLSEGQPSMEIYDPENASWSLESMPRGRRTFVVGQVNGELQIIGGETSPISPSGVFEEVDVYNPQSGEWSVLKNAPAPRHGAGFGTIGHSLIMTGGGEVSGSSFTDTTQIMNLE